MQTSLESVAGQKQKFREVDMRESQNKSGSRENETGPASKRTQKTGVRNAYANLNGAQVADHLESTHIGKFSTPGGTGFAAEDANALNDQLRGRKVERVGVDNAKDGADRIVNGKHIQTKYFDSASKTVGDAFGKDGNYRYKKMQLEVPGDQYEEALRLMRKRIADGKVPGVSSPDEAIDLVKKGSVTYKQARNIARAGNIDSLRYDAKNGAVTSGYAFAIGFAFNYASAVWNREDPKGALRAAMHAGLEASGTAFITSVVSSQLLRTQTARAGTILIRGGLKTVVKTKAGKVVIGKIASASLGKTVHGAAAVNHLSKLLRSNAITGAVTVTVLTLPDLYRASISKNTSWGQVGKNLVINASGVAAGTAGWMGGAVAGAAIGSAVPILGTAVGAVAGGIIGAVGAGCGGSAVAKYAMDFLVEDDAKAMCTIVEEELPTVAFDYLLTVDEFACFTEQAYNQLSSGFLKDMYASKDRKKYVADKFDSLAEAIAAERPIVNVPSEKNVRKFIDELLANAAEISGCAENSAEYAPNFIIVADTQESAVKPASKKTSLSRAVGC